MNRIRKTKNKIFAIPTAVPAIPPKPRRAAKRATTKNVILQLNIGLLLLMFDTMNALYLL